MAKIPRVPTERQVGERAVRVGRRMHARGLMVATAESCTGGWISKVLTDIAGSSTWFAAGVVTYSNSAKKDLIGVPVRTLKRFGAVSEETALAMAVGALKHLDADVSVSVTGVAGPGGGSPEKPVGTVWLAWATRSRSGISVSARRYRFKGARRQIRIQAVAAALQGLLRL